MLIEVIEGLVDPKDIPPDPVDVERNSMLYMQEVWEDVVHQLPCSSEHYACWDCPAARTVSCAIEECEPDILKKVQEGDI